MFALVPAGSDPPDEIVPIAAIREDEGLTLVVSQAQADAAGLSYEAPQAWITLRAHSSLAAVGLTAAVSNALSKAQISCNVVAAFHHDHIFVPLQRGQEARRVLAELR